MKLEVKSIENVCRINVDIVSLEENRIVQYTITKWMEAILFGNKYLLKSEFTDVISGLTPGYLKTIMDKAANEPGSFFHVRTLEELDICLESGHVERIKQ